MRPTSATLISDTIRDMKNIWPYFVTELNDTVVRCLPLTVLPAFRGRQPWPLQNNSVLRSACYSKIVCARQSRRRRKKKTGGRVRKRMRRCWVGGGGDGEKLVLLFLGSTYTHPRREPAAHTTENEFEIGRRSFGAVCIPSSVPLPMVPLEKTSHFQIEDKKK